MTGRAPRLHLARPTCRQRAWCWTRHPIRTWRTRRDAKQGKLTARTIQFGTITVNKISVEKLTPGTITDGTISCSKFEIGSLVPEGAVIERTKTGWVVRNLKRPLHEERKHRDALTEQVERVRDDLPSLVEPGSQLRVRGLVDGVEHDRHVTQGEASGVESPDDETELFQDVSPATSPAPVRPGDRSSVGDTGTATPRRPRAGAGDTAQPAPATISRYPGRHAICIDTRPIGHPRSWRIVIGRSPVWRPLSVRRGVAPQPRRLRLPGWEILIYPPKRGPQ